MLQVLQQNKSFSDFLFFKELYFLPATSATLCGSEKPLEQVEQQEMVVFRKALFKRVLFLPAPAAPPKGRHQKTPLGQMWQQKMVVFRKALFLESLVFICHTCPKGRSVSDQAVIFSAKVFVKFSILWVFKPLFLCYNV